MEDKNRITKKITQWAIKKEEQPEQEKLLTRAEWELENN